MWNVKQGCADFLFRAKRAHWTILGLKSEPKWSVLHVWARNPFVLRAGAVSASGLPDVFRHIVSVFEGRVLLSLAGRLVLLGCCLLRCYSHCVPQASFLVLPCLAELLSKLGVCVWLLRFLFWGEGDWPCHKGWLQNTPRACRIWPSSGRICAIWALVPGGHGFGCAIWARACMPFGPTMPCSRVRWAQCICAPRLPSCVPCSLRRLFGAR